MWGVLTLVSVGSDTELVSESCLAWEGTRTAAVRAERVVVVREEGEHPGGVWDR